MLNIKYYLDKDELINQGRDELIGYLRICQQNETKVLLCLSGGSALKLLEDFDFRVLGPHVTIVVLDERFSRDPKINNMAQVAAMGFLDQAKAAGCDVIDTQVREGETLEVFVARFDMALVRWRENHPRGVVVATAGMGSDGHTAGIIPGSEDFEKLFMQNTTGKWVVGYTAANQPEDREVRVTTTFEFLRTIVFAVLLVMGEEKGEAMQRLVAEDGSLSNTPARIWSEIAGNALLLTDLGETR